MSSSNLFAVQFDIAWEDRAENFRRVRQLLASTPPAPGSLVVLPEMFASGFSMNLNATRQTPAAEGESFLAELATEYRVFIVGGVVSRGSGEMGRNEAVVFSPEGRLLARYAKIHPFSLGGEAQGHEAGTKIVTFNWGGLVVAPFVCQTGSSDSPFAEPRYNSTRPAVRFHPEVPTKRSS